MAQATKLVQLRVPPELYDDLIKAVAERQRQGQRASINRVALEWLTKGQRVDGEDQAKAMGVRAERSS